MASEMYTQPGIISRIQSAAQAPPTYIHTSALLPIAVAAEPNSFHQSITREGTP